MFNYPHIYTLPVAITIKLCVSEFYKTAVDQMQEDREEGNVFPEISH